MNNQKQVVRIKLGGLWAITLMGFLSVSARADYQSVAQKSVAAEVTLTGAGSVSFSISMHKISDNSFATSMTWSSVTLPSGFLRADTYIQLNSTISAVTGGIQIYTNNRVDVNNLKFMGSPNDNPAGLLDITEPKFTLPLAWTIKDTTSTPPAVADPNDMADNNSWQWFYVKDWTYQTETGRQYPLVPGEDYITMRRARTIQVTTGGYFLPADSPDYVYLEANFQKALTPRTYRTNTLTIESYTQ